MPERCTNSFVEYVIENVHHTGYLVFSFYACEDSPFSFSSGMCIACYDGYVASAIRCLGFNGVLIETKSVNIT